MLRSDRYRLFVDLGLKVAELSLNIVESANLLGEGFLEGCGLRVQLSMTRHQQAREVKDVQLRTERDHERARHSRVHPIIMAPDFADYCLNSAPGIGNTYISKLNFTHFTQSTDDFSTNLIGNVELGQGHVARAKEGILGDRHDAMGWAFLATEGLTRAVSCTQCVSSL